MNWVCKIKGHKLFQTLQHFKKNVTLRTFLCTRCHKYFGKFTPDAKPIPWSQTLDETWQAYRKP